MWLEILRSERSWPVESRPLLANASAHQMRLRAQDSPQAAVLRGQSLDLLLVVKASEPWLRQAGQSISAVSVVILLNPEVTDLGWLETWPRLRAIALVDAAGLESLEGVNAQPDVEALLIENARRVRALDPLAPLTKLRELALEGLLSRGSNQVINSLAPLGHLLALERLFFSGVVARDGDLAPLRRLTRLKEIQLPNFYTIEQVGQLAGALPGLKGFGVQPYELDSAAEACGRCGSQKQVQLIGRTRGRFACLSCDSAKIMAHLKAFENWRSVGASHGTG